MKNAGDETTPITELLNLDFTDSKLQLNDEQIFLGAKVESFMKEIGLTRSSSEMMSWLGSVRLFYVEALQRCVKYMKPSLISRTLLNLKILSY